MPERSSVFDMIGPVMIGPSSSHTAGVVRIGQAGVKILGGIPNRARITFYNSFARTYQGHGSDRAIVGGLLDFKTDDKRIKTSFEFARKKKLQYTFQSVVNASTLHPNTIKLNLKLGKKELEVIGESLGGGVINIAEVDGFAANFSTNLHTLIVKAEDVKGSIAFISDVISHDDCNIATMSVSRRGKHGEACQFIEMDSSIKPITLEYLRSFNWVREVIYIPDIQM